MTYRGIINKKKNLLLDLANNIFADFTDIDDLYLHSKHGYLSLEPIDDFGAIEGKVGAFKKGLPIIFEDDFNAGIIEDIDWNDHTIITKEGKSYRFQFTPYHLDTL